MTREIKFEVVQELNIKKTKKKSLSAQQIDGFIICLDIEPNLVDLP